MHPRMKGLAESIATRHSLVEGRTYKHLGGPSLILVNCIVFQKYELWMFTRCNHASQTPQVIPHKIMRPHFCTAIPILPICWLSQGPNSHICPDRSANDWETPLPPPRLQGTGGLTPRSPQHACARSVIDSSHSAVLQRVYEIILPVCPVLLWFMLLLVRAWAL